MELDLSFFETLGEIIKTDYVALFLIVGLGYIFGRIQIKGISLDISAIIFVAMVFGHFGVRLPKVVSDIGLVLFIFTIGIQAGPGFFEALKRDGVKMALLSLVMAASAAAVAVGLGYIYDIDLATISGILTGAMTSTPGLATAKEVFNTPLQESLVGVGYAISYPFGVIGIILILRVLPKLFRKNMDEEDAKWEQEANDGYPEVHHRHFVITNPNINGQSLLQVGIRKMTGANVSRVEHEGVCFTPSRETVLFNGDIVRAVGTEEALRKAQMLFGKETEKELKLSPNYDVRTVLVTNRKIVNKKLVELSLQENYDATVTRIRRSGIDIVPSPSSKLRFADKLIVACHRDSMKQVEKVFGNDQKSLDKNDFLPIAIGIVLGVALGKFTPLGLTGGVLFAALILGRIGKTGPILWTMNGTANTIIRELGLILFLAYTGISSGEQIVEQLTSNGLPIFIVGVVVSVVPMVVGVLMAMYLLKINFVSMLGALSGSMTSTPGLAAITPMSKTNAPQIAYATIYPFALVALVVIIRLMALFV